MDKLLWRTLKHRSILLTVGETTEIKLDAIIEILASGQLDSPTILANYVSIIIIFF